MADVSANLQPALEQLLLAVADDKLVLGHRNSDWTGLGPTLEEDIAFSALAQDSIAHASALYELIAKLRGGGDSDRIAFDRPAEQFRCAQLLELPDEFDYALALAREFYFVHFDMLRLKRLSASSWKPLADLASRLSAEAQVHLDHVDSWVRRLGPAGGEAADRLQHALDTLAPLAVILFEPVEEEDQLVESGLYPAGEGDMYEQWRQTLIDIARESALSLQITPGAPSDRGGRRGEHSEHLKPLYDEMTEVYRLEPGAAW